MADDGSAGLRFAPCRRAQTAFLRRLRDEGRWRSARCRIAVCHVPFSMVQHPPSDIEQDVYRDWVRLLNGMELLRCGHMRFACAAFYDGRGNAGCEGWGSW